MMAVVAHQRPMTDKMPHQIEMLWIYRPGSATRRCQRTLNYGY